MRIDELKKALQDDVKDDVGTLYSGFVEESGSGDLVGFVMHLVSAGHVAEESVQSLLADGTLDPDVFAALKKTHEDGEPETAAVEGDDTPSEAVVDDAAEASDSPASDDGSPDTSADASPTESADEVGSEQPAEAESAPETPAADDVAAEAGAAPSSEEVSASSEEVSAPDASASEEKPERQKRRTGGAADGRRRSGSRRRASSSVSARRISGEKGATSTAARDRLKRTMFSLRQENEDHTDTTDLLRRDYKFVGTVGEGAMGKVLRARDNDLLRLVAYKVMSEEIASNATMASKFYAEAQITAQLDHPNIVPVYQLEQDAEGMLAYTMKLIKGKTVEDYIEEVKAAYQKHGKKGLPEEFEISKRLEIFLRCCDALYYAHRRGVVHRDLKPENIMIGSYGEVYIMDWGIAKVVKGGDILTEQPIELLYDPKEEAELIIGTPQYMSPEQANGENEDLDHRSDQYAMGLILYEMLSLNQAVTGKNAMKIVRRQQEADREPLKHAYGDKIHPELRAVMEKTLSKDKGSRYQHIKAVADDIRHHLQDEPIMAKSDGVVQKLGRWIRRNTALTAGLVGMVLLAAIVGVVLTVAVSAISQWQAQQRNMRITALRTTSYAKAAEIDGQFIKYEGLLGTAAATASEKLNLSSQNSDAKRYTPQDFGTAGTVPGMTTSELYGSEVSLEFPVFYEVAADDPTATSQLDKLADIGPNLRTLLLRSESEQAARFTPARYKRRIASQGTPISWSFIALESGGYVHFPGTSKVGDADPRKDAWYSEVKKVAARRPGPRWSVPYVDRHGLGYAITVSQPLFELADKSKFMGVTGLSLTADYVIDEFLQMDENILGVERVMLLDKKGNVLISSDMKGATPGEGAGESIALEQFGVPEVVEAIGRFEKEGSVEVGSDLVIYDRLENLEWYLVIRGDYNEMMKSEI